MKATSRHARSGVLAIGTNPLEIVAVLTLAVGVALALIMSVSISKEAYGATTGEDLLKNLTITSTTINPRTHVVTVKTKVTFAPAVRRAWVGARVSQVGRYHTVQGDRGRMVRREPGDPARMAFTFRISAYEGRFVPGKATVEAGAETYLRRDGRWLHDWDYLKEGVHLSVSH